MVHMDAQGCAPRGGGVDACTHVPSTPGMLWCHGISACSRLAPTHLRGAGMPVHPYLYTLLMVELYQVEV